MIRLTASRAYQLIFWSLIPRRWAPFADPCEQPHPSVDLDGIAVDVGVAELVRACWRAGMPTISSCQGDAPLYDLYASRHPANGQLAANEHSAYIGFETVADGMAAKHWVKAQLPAHGAPIVQLVVSAEDYCFLHVRPSDMHALSATSVPVEAG